MKVINFYEMFSCVFQKHHPYMYVRACWSDWSHHTCTLIVMVCVIVIIMGMRFLLPLLHSMVIDNFMRILNSYKKRIEQTISGYALKKQHS